MIIKLFILFSLTLISAILCFLAPLAYEANMFSSTTISLFKDYPIPELAMGMVAMTVLLIGFILTALFVQWRTMKPVVVVTALLTLVLQGIVLYIACTEMDGSTLFSAVRSMISERSPHPIAIFNIMLSLGVVIFASFIKEPDTVLTKHNT